MAAGRARSLATTRHAPPRARLSSVRASRVRLYTTRTDTTRTCTRCRGQSVRAREPRWWTPLGRKTCSFITHNRQRLSHTECRVTPQTDSMVYKSPTRRATVVAGHAHAGRCRGSEPGALKHARSRPRWHRARAGGGHARRPVLHLAHKATSCIAFLGDSPETQSSWQRGDVLRRVYLAMLEEDVHMIAGSDKWEHVTARSGGW